MTDLTQVPLTHLDVISLQGNDVIKFLQGQCTQDVQHLDINQPVAGAFCSAKGRTIANVVLIQVATEPTQVLMVCEHGSADLLTTHLKKYAAFFRTMIFDYQPQSWSLVGVIGADIHSQLTALAENYPTAHVCPWSESQALMVFSPDQPSPVQPEPSSTALPHWQALDIQHNRLWLNADQSGEWIPQNVNLDELNAISFKKGCYTGQEVIARLHYKGQSKKRLFQLMLNEERELYGETVYHNGKSIGQIIQSAAWQGKTYALAVLKSDSVQPPMSIDENQQVNIELLH